ncbi:MAG: Na+/H+ antiporter subunit E [Pseudohongiellaceae bacterium]
MNLLTLNIVLAVSWMLINGSFSIFNFIVGFAVGFVSLSLTQATSGSLNYGRQAWAAVRLLAFFLKEVVITSIKVVWDVLTPTHLSEPDIIHYPLDAKTDLEIMLLANMVSMTPGSLTLDISEDRSHLIIHAMFARDKAAVIAELKNGLEKRLLEVTRG